MSKKPDTHRSQSVDVNAERANLDHQYRRIGISAVAAALPFVGRIKNPAKTSSHWDDNRASGSRKRSVLSV